MRAVHIHVCSQELDGFVSQDGVATASILSFSDVDQFPVKVNVIYCQISQFRDPEA